MENEIPKEPEGALAKPAPQKITTISHDQGEFSCFLDTAKFNQLWRVAQVFAGSQLVPQHYQGSASNCFVAMQMSIRLNVDPMMFMQNTFVIHGKPGMLSQLVIALINARGPFEGPIQWKFTGKGKERACTAYAKHKTTSEVCEATVSWAMATAEGWTTKKGSKWQTMPDLMFQYRSAAFLGRLYCPECLMGMRTIDELNDIKANEETNGDAPAAGVAGLKDRMAKQVESKEVAPPEQIAPAIDETLDAKRQEQIAAVTETESNGSDAPESKDEFDEHVENFNSEPDHLDQPEDPAAKQAEETAAAKFGTENDQEPCRYECKDCNREFDEPTPSGKCPFCIKDNVKDRQKS